MRRADKEVVKVAGQEQEQRLVCLCEETNEVWRARQAHAVASKARLIVGKGVGPKKRHYRSLSHAKFTCAEWAAFMAQQGSEGGAPAEEVQWPEHVAACQ
eukprot:4518887-Lingulodinium_polyedra.AAC.1